MPPDNIANSLLMGDFASVYKEDGAMMPCHVSVLDTGRQQMLPDVHSQNGRVIDGQPEFRRAEADDNNTRTIDQ